MARTNKSGIDYFPFDVDFFQDEKVQFVSARFGTKGEAIIVRLLCKIYRNGYYVEFDDDTALLFAKSVGDGCQDSFVKDVVYELLKRGFFDKSIFERFSILTSRGIQNRYFEAVKRYKTVEVISEYLLVNVEEMNNVNIIEINVNINSINVDINSQKKRERKEKEIENEKKIKPQKGESDYEVLDELSFENVWLMYQRKGNKKSSQRRWDGLPKKAKLLAVEHIPRYVEATPDEKYRKNFETYINQEAWNDKIITKNGTANGITNTANSQAMGNGYSGNGANTFRTDAERRRNERQMLTQMATAVLQQPET
ncbi:MAG: hypothetical protein EZS26_000768 [Candidatus Ordinivivax streblomastigis]|uniref:Lin1244/Lin1753-like N-terminal domain-containing protein n=1 Tax=Candidatus Ordinivivax streblomastigis TaxID=2540710 RepID=A0A5M8P3V2_9BACT|nr:MAG: hypothetical protein EZS26_000768 [Candidatus Ordinivivax streblomastigis]